MNKNIPMVKFRGGQDGPSNQSIHRAVVSKGVSVCMHVLTCALIKNPISSSIFFHRLLKVRLKKQSLKHLGALKCADRTISYVSAIARQPPSPPEEAWTVIHQQNLLPIFSLFLHIVAALSD